MAFIGLLHVAGWLTLFAVVVPQHLSVGTTAFGLGIGVTAYMLGVRHAFDGTMFRTVQVTVLTVRQRVR